ncbi:MAG: hypothetical protein M3Q60_10970 [Actinomycetota bacterium]|nr:hypothetical protein [Actinomycetota bacterium]
MAGRRRDDGQNFIMLLADARSDEGKRSLEALLKAAGGRASAMRIADGLQVVRYLPGVDERGSDGRG